MPVFRRHNVPVTLFVTTGIPDATLPLWSAGAVWEVSKESFYKVDWLPTLRLRASYGFNGNVYNGSAYVTGNYATAQLTGAPSIDNLDGVCRTVLFSEQILGLSVSNYTLHLTEHPILDHSTSSCLQIQ